MTDWTAGYVTDIGYTYGYYAELNPQRLALPLLAAGVVPPPRVEAACELGFGQGISVNIHAAASGVPWWGTDFTPPRRALRRSWPPPRAQGPGCSIRPLRSSARGAICRSSTSSACTASGAGFRMRTGR